MPLQVVNTAQIACSFGTTPSVLTVLPVNRVNVGHQPAATIMDHQPLVNIAPFGMCLSLANPQVVAATSADAGRVHAPALHSDDAGPLGAGRGDGADRASTPALDNVSPHPVPPSMTMSVNSRSSRGWTAICSSA